MSQRLRVSLFEKFGAIGSQSVFQSFKTGLEKNGVSVNSHDLSADVAVIWSVLWRGTMKQNQAIWNHFKKDGRSIVVLESGALNRGQLFRVGLNGINRGAYDFIKDKDDNRPKTLAIELSDWKLNGSKILICTQHDSSQQWEDNVSVAEYISDMVEQIRRYSSKSVVIRSHPRCRLNPKFIPAGVTYQPAPMRNDSENFKSELKNDVYAVINYSSNPGIESAIAGVPVYTSEKSLAYPVSIKNLSMIETPDLPDRSQWLIDVCHTEWTETELCTGNVQHQLLTMIGSLT